MGTATFDGNLLKERDLSDGCRNYHIEGIFRYQNFLILYLCRILNGGVVYVD